MAKHFFFVRSWSRFEKDRMRKKAPHKVGHIRPRQSCPLLIINGRQFGDQWLYRLPWWHLYPLSLLPSPFGCIFFLCPPEERWGAIYLCCAFLDKKTWAFPWTRDHFLCLFWINYDLADGAIPIWWPPYCCQGSCPLFVPTDYDGSADAIKPYGAMNPCLVLCCQGLERGPIKLQDDYTIRAKVPSVPFYCYPVRLIDSSSFYDRSPYFMYFSDSRAVFSLPWETSFWAHPQTRMTFSSFPLLSELSRFPCECEMVISPSPAAAVSVTSGKFKFTRKSGVKKVNHVCAPFFPPPLYLSKLRRESPWGGKAIGYVAMASWLRSSINQLSPFLLRKTKNGRRRRSSLHGKKGN